ncbi:radical SAM protein [Thiorhodovibrio winogradskyi]|uniref:radical SAM protein n=1 Tax=Thiorhodovibrio winogradskyi TaxID=77007 RepID=UPI002E2AD81C|nr:hypothetical protein [Thiorhodovibrio winogradskyi]
MRFVEGINFELTYDCPLACHHCLQADLRRAGKTGWAAPEMIVQTIHEAVDLGLTSTGINFTGGEIFVPGSPLSQFLQVTKELGVPVRINTSGWWVHGRPFQIGERTFSNTQAVVDWLKDSGVAMLAISWDRRFTQYPILKQRVCQLIDACEQRQLPYQIAITAATAAEDAALTKDLEQHILRPPFLGEIVSMDMVDLGAARTCMETAQREPQEPLNTLIARTPCGGRGIYRPSFLHIAPDGGLRSCMYASGANWLGSIAKQSLTELLQIFATNPVVAAFASGQLERLIMPAGPSRPAPADWPRHPCAVAARCAASIHKIYQNKHHITPC